MDHAVNEHGIITDPGKFEGSTSWAIFFYDLIMDGGSDDECGDCSTVGRIDSAFFLAKDDSDIIAKYPDLADVECVVITETDTGFVSGCTCTIAEWKAFKAEQEASEDAQDNE
jgi:hypothetical protein